MKSRIVENQTKWRTQRKRLTAIVIIAWRLTDIEKYYYFCEFTAHIVNRDNRIETVVEVVGLIPRPLSILVYVIRNPV